MNKVAEVASKHAKPNQRMPMKTILIVAILSFGLLPALGSKAEARSCSSTQIFISGYQRCGTPIYRVRYISGYTHCGRAIWRVRALTRGEWYRYQRTNHRNRYHRSGYDRHPYQQRSRWSYRCRGW